MNALRYSDRPATNEHERNIQTAARQLCSQGKPEFIYVTQWQSGTTAWRNPVDDTRITVKAGVKHG